MMLLYNIKTDQTFLGKSLCEVIFGRHMLEALVFQIEQEVAGRTCESHNQLIDLSDAVSTSSRRRRNLELTSQETRSCLRNMYYYYENKVSTKSNCQSRGFCMYEPWTPNVSSMLPWSENVDNRQRKQKVQQAFPLGGLSDHKVNDQTCTQNIIG